MNNTKFAGLALATETPARLTIRHPVTKQVLRLNDTSEDAWIDLMATSSRAGRAHDRAVNDRLMRARGQRYTAEQAEADLVEKFATLTQGWSLATLAGDPIEVECSLANARELYSMPELDWLREQVAEFVADLGNFRSTPGKS